MFQVTMQEAGNKLQVLIPIHQVARGSMKQQVIAICNLLVNEWMNHFGRSRGDCAPKNE